MAGDDSGKWFVDAETRLQRKFAHFGPEVMQVLQRVFRRYGNFKPLLQHLSLDATGDLDAQQLVLQRCLSQHGKVMFLEAVDVGQSPGALALAKTKPVSQNDTDANLTPEPAADVSTTASFTPVVPQRYDLASQPDRRRRHDRRSKVPGRRQKLDLAFCDNRRKGSCRRRGPRRANEV